MYLLNYNNFGLITNRQHQSGEITGLSGCRAICAVFAKRTRADAAAPHIPARSTIETKLNAGSSNIYFANKYVRHTPVTALLEIYIDTLSYAQISDIPDSNDRDATYGV